jgi:hypothetical protein
VSFPESSDAVDAEMAKESEERLHLQLAFFRWFVFVLA